MSEEELARRECAEHGHYLDVVETMGRGPTAVVCSHCGRSWPVAALPEAGATQENRKAAIAWLRMLADAMEASLDVRVAGTITVSRDHFNREDLSRDNTVRTSTTTINIRV